MDFITLTNDEFSAMSEDEFSALVGSHSALAQPTIQAVTTYDGGYYGGVIVRYKAFAITVANLTAGASLRLFVDGVDAGLGAVQQDGSVLFMEVVLPLGWTNLSIRQELNGEVSDMSPYYAARVNTAENVSVSIPSPKIHPDGGTFANWPVWVTITSEVAGHIYYCVDGTGVSQPTVKYRGPFRLYQTGVVKAKVKFTQLRSFTPVESLIAERTIRIVR